MNHRWDKHVYACLNFICFRQAISKPFFVVSLSLQCINWASSCYLLTICGESCTKFRSILLCILSCLCVLIYPLLFNILVGLRFSSYVLWCNQSQHFYQWTCLNQRKSPEIRFSTRSHPCCSRSLQNGWWNCRRFCPAPSLHLGILGVCCNRRRPRDHWAWHSRLCFGRLW